MTLSEVRGGEIGLERKRGRKEGQLLDRKGKGIFLVNNRSENFFHRNEYNVWFFFSIVTGKVILDIKAMARGIEDMDPSNE